MLVQLESGGSVEIKVTINLAKATNPERRYVAELVNSFAQLILSGTADVSGPKALEEAQS